METFEYRSWIVEVDREATVARYAGRGSAAAECGCVSCRNFIAARPTLFPAAAMALLAQLGVDLTRETAVVGYGDDGASGAPQLYEGAFHFVGRVVDREHGWPSAENAAFHGLPALGPSFGAGFTEIGAAGEPPMEFDGQPTAVLSFAAEVPWLLDSRADARPAQCDGVA